MPYKRLKKDYRGRKKGDVFLASRTMTGDPRKDMVKEAYLQRLVRETKTHDLNDTWTDLDKEARQTVKELRKMQKTAAENQMGVGKLKAKLDVITEIIQVLKDIQASGRTRVGESELKTIASNVMKRRGIDPRTLGLKVL